MAISEVLFKAVRRIIKSDERRVSADRARKEQRDGQTAASLAALRLMR